MPNIYLHQDKARYYSTGDYFKRAADKLGIVANRGISEYQQNIHYDFIIHFDQGCPTKHSDSIHTYIERDAHSTSIFDSQPKDKKYYCQYSSSAIINDIWDTERVILHAADPTTHKRIIKPTVGTVFVGRKYGKGDVFDRGEWIEGVADGVGSIKIHGDGHTPKDYNELLNQGHVILNHSLHGEINRRVFEGMAVGALLTDEVFGLDTIGVAGEDFFTYPKNSTPKQVSDIINELLANIDNTHRVAENGRQLILKKHTYEHRFKQLLNKIGYYEI